MSRNSPFLAAKGAAREALMCGVSQSVSQTYICKCQVTADAVTQDKANLLTSLL